jgi:hypothetical protein
MSSFSLPNWSTARVVRSVIWPSRATAICCGDDPCQNEQTGERLQQLPTQLALQLIAGMLKFDALTGAGDCLQVLIGEIWVKRYAAGRAPQRARPTDQMRKAAQGRTRIVASFSLQFSAPRPKVGMVDGGGVAGAGLDAQVEQVGQPVNVAFAYKDSTGDYPPVADGAGYPAVGPGWSFDDDAELRQCCSAWTPSASRCRPCRRRRGAGRDRNH